MRSIAGFAFPQTPQEVRVWKETKARTLLSSDVMICAHTRRGCMVAYCKAVPGLNHDAEEYIVREQGDKLPYLIAAVIFPIFKDLPYAN